MSEHTINANDFLMAGGVPSAKFPTIGTTVTGTITREPEVMQQTDFTTGAVKTWDDGKPRMQMKVVLATAERDPADLDDDGERAIYVKGQLTKAVREAVRRSGANGIAVGGTLAVTYTADGTPSRPGLNPPKIFAATYTPPTAAAVADFLGTNEPAPVTAVPAQPMNQAQLAAAARANQAPAPAPVAAPAPAGVSPEALAAIAALTPEQKAALNLSL